MDRTGMNWERRLIVGKMENVVQCFPRTARGGEQ
jgi:hypothetical protein